MQTPTTIALLAAEVAHMRHTIDEAEASGAAKRRAAIGPLGTIDDYIARQRALEVCMSFHRPRSAGDAAILAAHLLERAEIVRNDYAAPGGFDDAAAEVDRLAAGLAGWHGTPTTDDAARNGPGLIASLAADLEKAWDFLDALDAAARSEVAACAERAHLQANLLRASKTIHAIETGIAAARIRTDDDAKTAATLLFAETEATCDGRGRMLALGLAAYFGDAGAASVESLRRRYGPRKVASPVSTLAAEGKLSAVH